MLDIPVVNMAGQKVGSMSIDENEFGGEVSKQLLHEAVLMYQANKRVGTAKTKTRAEVAGSGRKLFRQKGTGNARVGDRRTAKRKGGGTAFGPKPRSYRIQMPKKARRLAAKMAMLSKFQDAEAIVVDNLTMPAIKTKDMIKSLKTLGVGGASVLIATAGQDKNIYLSGRNIKGVEILPDRDLNAYTLLKRKRLVISKDALEQFRKRHAEPVDGVEPAGKETN